MTTHEFFTLLPQFTVVDNQLRYAAETRYSALLRDQADYAVLGLLHVLGSNQIEGHIRQLAAVLLRRSLIDDEESIYFRLSGQSKQDILKELLRLLREEPTTIIRLRVCDIAGELGGSILEPKDWVDLVPTALLLCQVSHLYDCIPSLCPFTHLSPLLSYRVNNQLIEKLVYH